MIFEYETLKLIWFCLIGILMMAFAITGGADLGVGALLPFLARTDEERRLMLNSIGPTWEGNQVWLITTAAAFFAAWPFFYALAFSSLYFVLFLSLLALILRPPGIDYRSKLPSPLWRRFWDYSLCFSGWLPSFVFGLVFGNVFLGLPFHYDESLRPYFTGGFLSLLNPYAFLMGAVSLCLLLTHGAFFLQIKTVNTIQARARKASLLFGILFIGLFLGAWAWTLQGIVGFKILMIKNLNESLIPPDKVVDLGLGYWKQNYHLYPIGHWLPIFTVLAMLLALGCNSLARFRVTAFFFSACSIIGAIASLGFTLFPFLLPSSTFPNHSLTLWDAVSSYLTLTWMFWAVLFFLPIVIIYTAWVFRIMRGSLGTELY